MTLENRKTSFIELGSFLRRFLAENATEKKFEGVEKDIFQQLTHAIEKATQHNGWFTLENIRFSLKEWAVNLEKEALENWLKDYNFQQKKPKTVAIIMAGNIPLVGFHDFLSVLISGHRALVKQSSNDKILLPVIADFLILKNKAWESFIEFVPDQLPHFDAVIATGSNNTSRYFEYYFSKKPHLIRKNRNSIAVLDGQETPEELAALGEDIFQYYGLGCRSVSKIFVPKNYDFKNFFEAIYPWGPIIHQHKYANNYDYNKAVYLMSNFKLLDNEFLLLKEDQSYASPISVLFYEFYENEEALYEKLMEDSEKIQCTVARKNKNNTLSFGSTQHPKLNDYADGIDPLKFLQDL